MAGYQHCLVFRTPTGYLTSGGGAADSDFPHANAADITSPHWPWQSAANAVSGTTFYGVDFGSAVTLEGVGIDNINLAAVKLQAASDTGFSADLITTDLTIGPNLVERSLFASGTTGLQLGRYKHFLSLAGTSFAAASRRYWRILANTSTSITGSAAPMWVGSVAWCRTLSDWGSGTSNYDERPLEATLPGDDWVGGGMQPTITGNPTSAIILGAAPGDTATMRAPMLEILRHGARPFLFYRNNGDAADFYICHRAGDVTVSGTYGLINVNNFVMRSAV